MPFAKFEPDSDEEAFINKIKENYFDDTARLVFADFLEERGDPRGPFFRLQVQAAQLEQEELSARAKGKQPSVDLLNRRTEIAHKINELHRDHGGPWYGPLWTEAARGHAGHRFVRGMLRVYGSPSSFSYVGVQKVLAWADSVQVDHDAGGMAALEKLFERNQICCLAFSSWTVMLTTMRLRFLRWLHRKSRRLPSRVVAVELGHGVTQEMFNLIAALPDHVLDQLRYIQAGPDWNQPGHADACAAALSNREWTGTFNGRP